ncbi:hypothetical protein E4L96_16105, partial [Massilia arenosa]
MPIKPLLAAALLAASLPAAHAATTTIDLNSLGQAPAAMQWTVPHAGGAFEDIYRFHWTDQPSPGSAMLAALLDGSAGLGGLQLALHTGDGYQLTEPSATGMGVMMVDGDFAIHVSGTADDSGTASYHLSMEAVVHAVPEPAGWALLLAGGAVLGAWR